MADDEDAKLGGRLPLLDPESLEGEQKELYQRLWLQLISWADVNEFRGATDDGKLIGPFNPYLYSTGETPGFLDWMQADSHGTTLNKRVHEVVILSVGAIWKSPYELYAHSAVARHVGVPEAAIQALCESHWFRWRLGLLDFDQVLVGPPGIVERGFELCRWQVAEVAVQAAGVVPVHPAQGRQLEVVVGLPRAAAGRPVDQLSLV